MKTPIALSFVFALCSGCTHYANIERVDSPAAADGVEVYESSRVDRNGNVRATVQERISDDADGCQSVRVRRDYYSPQGELTRRVVERRHCGYTVLRISEDWDGAGWRRELLVDHDRDGVFDEAKTAHVSSEGQLAAK